VALIHQLATGYNDILQTKQTFILIDNLLKTYTAVDNIVMANFSKPQL